MALAAPTMDFSGSANAPVYAEDAASAEDAYNQAVANTAAKRGQLYNQAGFKATQGAGGTTSYDVDGLNPTGEYQQLQKGEGQQLEAQHEADMSRNIGTKGIAEQNTSNLRYGNAVAQTNFGNGLLNANDSLDDANTNAFGTYQQTLLNLQLQAISDARAAQSFPGTPSTPSSGGDPTPNPSTPAPGSVAPNAPNSPDANGYFNVSPASVAPKNVNAKTVKTTTSSDVDPKILALAAQVAAAKKASTNTRAGQTAKNSY